MSVIIKQIAKESSDIPKLAIGILAAIFVLSMFIVGYDQGQLVQALAAPMGIH
ncbi:MAG: hypothetical protein JO297_20855, partial [Nitrososphaeraceae archaeon]|nr:hypothetical protein [Nitrososphaeraceae archaeon]